MWVVWRISFSWASVEVIVGASMLLLDWIRYSFVPMALLERAVGSWI